VPWGKMFKAAKVAIKAIGVGKRLVEGYSKLKAASKALADIPRWNPKVVPDAAAIKQANTAAEQAKAAANQSRTVASRTSREVDDAKRANDQARKAAENKKSDTCNSFVPGTGVLMGDGSVKAIDDVAVGDTVVAVAADGTRTHRQVVATITGHGAKDLVGLTLVGSGGGGPPAGETITATDGHLFLTADGEWVPAGELQAGDQLVGPDGTPVAIAAIEHDSVVATVHNLTVDTDHTYTVVTRNGTDVVTHNENFIELRDVVGDAQAVNAACPAGSSSTALPARASKEDLTLGGQNQRAGVALVNGDIDAPGVREIVDEAGDAFGCHTCGARTSGLPSGGWIPDHQPPTALVPPGSYQTAFPHCRACALRQGGVVSQIVQNAARGRGKGF